MRRWSSLRPAGGAGGTIAILLAISYFTSSLNNSFVKEWYFQYYCNLLSVVGWHQLPAQHLHNCSLTPCPKEDREKIEKAIAWELRSWDSLISEGKRKKIRDAKAVALHIPQADKCPASLRATSTLEDKTHTFFSCYLFYCWTWHLMVGNILFTSLDQLCPLPISCLLPATHWRQGCREGKK